MRIRYWCVFLLCSTGVFAQTSSEKKVTPQIPQTAGGKIASLPVRKVVLYKNGVGYFEHTGRVWGNQDLRIEFTTAQLNDVLKSLTLVDLNGGRINAVHYNSVAPLDVQLRGLQIPLGEDVTSAALLIALRGTRVEVHSGATSAAGRIFSVETIEKAGSKENPIQATQLAIVTDAGEMRLFEMSPGVTVRAADPEIHRDIDRYLSLMGTTRSKDLRRMTIGASGNGEREVMVSYISEVPVWKSTYRIVLPKAPAKAFLQGWAIVDNTVGEDWNDVKLSLVSGTPQSFIQNISQPYYARRPVVPLPESVLLTPQAHGPSMEARKWMAPLALQGGVPGGVAGGSAGGVMGGVIGGAGMAPGKFAEEPDRVEESTEVSELLSKEEAAAEGTAVGDLFEYNLKEKITVLKNQSALVPIVQSAIEAEKITLVTSDEIGGLEGIPLRALWLKNSSGLTLDGGTFNVLEQDSFAGEGIMELLHPGERRLISFAADKAVRVVQGTPTGSRAVRKTTIVKGVMAVHREERNATTYVIHNADVAPRQVVLEYPIRSGWKLEEEMKPEESSATRYRFRVEVAPGQTDKFSVRESRPEVSRIHISTLTDGQLAAFVVEGAVTALEEQELRKVIAKKGEIAAVDQEIKTRQQEMESIEKGQARLRENMKALKGSPEEKALLLRYTRELDGQEDRLAALQKETGEQKAKREGLQAQFEAMVEGISIEEKMTTE
jgi:hypothetical protein